MLHSDGNVEIETTPLDATPGDPLWLCVDPEPVRSGDVGLFHKTTDRRHYDERMRRHPGAKLASWPSQPVSVCSTPLFMRLKRASAERSSSRKPLCLSSTWLETTPCQTATSVSPGVAYRCSPS